MGFLIVLPARTSATWSALAQRASGSSCRRYRHPMQTYWKSQQ
jgi:hypothetical protein